MFLSSVGLHQTAKLLAVPAAVVSHALWCDVKWPVYYVARRVSEDHVKCCYRTVALPDWAAAASHRVYFIFPRRRFAHLSPNFTRGNAKFSLDHSTPFAFEPPSFRNGARYRYQKYFKILYAPDDWAVSCINLVQFAARPSENTQAP